MDFFLFKGYKGKRIKAQSPYSEGKGLLMSSQMQVTLF